MTAFEIVKSAYPGIPDAILNEYAELLPAEASALSAEFAASNFFFTEYIKNTPEKISTKYSINLGQYGYYANFHLNLLNPQNSQYARAVDFDSPPLHVPIGVAVNEDNFGFSVSPDGSWATYIKPRLITRYDSRLFEQVENNIVFGFAPSGDTFMHDYLFIMSFTGLYPTFAPSKSVKAYVGESFLMATVAALRKKYNGIDSVLALYENGVTLPDVNYEKAYSFLTYVNAYKKFSTEIDSERAYLQREAQAQLASYRQDYTDRAQREKSDLQSKKIQMLMAIDNDTKAATRDFQNMLLNAQNLKQNLRGQIG